jgi:hypothetical protein
MCTGIPTADTPLLSTSTPWGRDLSTTVAEERLSGERSTLSVIELGATGHRVGTHHVVVG